MNRHHLHFVLRQYIAHKDPQNLRLHMAVHGIGWLALTSALSQVPLPFALPLLGANLGAYFVALSFVYWLLADVLVTAFVVALTLAWAALPLSGWGPGHGFWGGVAIPLVTFVVMGAAAHLGNVYHHERGQFLKGAPPLRAAVDGLHVWIFGSFHFWLDALLHAGWRPRLKAQLDQEERVTLRG
ncbi:MAG TPA: hypothetical protein VJU61_14900, partial [Polyangiaceae bacterium]|nr:hypothetical protein [Polyangiaceae bacterium]